jgi:hypothetical protein
MPPPVGWVWPRRGQQGEIYDAAEITPGRARRGCAASGQKIAGWLGPERSAATRGGPSLAAPAWHVGCDGRSRGASIGRQSPRCRGGTRKARSGRHAGAGRPPIRIAGRPFASNLISGLVDRHPPWSRPRKSDCASAHAISLRSAGAAALPSRQGRVARLPKRDLLRERAAILRAGVRRQLRLRQRSPQQPLPPFGAGVALRRPLSSSLRRICQCSGRLNMLVILTPT